jgi:hypothetical protein
MKIILSFFYRLGGADYNLLKLCSPETRVRYRNLALSLLLSVSLAGFGGFKVASQFTDYLPYILGVAAFWAVATLSFDYFLINDSSDKGIFKKIRIIVGLANVCITITALFITLNQATIDTQIRLDNSEVIKKVDENYLKAKEGRYNAVNKQKAEAEKYNQEVVLPEAKNGYPGPHHAKKKAVYDGMITAVQEETAKLDTLEQQYLTAYQTERAALEAKQSNDIFSKVKMLPGVMWNGGWLTLFLGVCAFIFLSYIELQAISLKLSMSKDDEYHKMRKAYKARIESFRIASAESIADLESRKILLNSSKQEKEVEIEEYEFFMSVIDDRIVWEAEIRGKIAILRKKGFNSNADSLEAKLEKFIKASSNGDAKKTSNDEKTTSSKKDVLSEEIFKLTQPMEDTLKSIQDNSTPENLAESIFNWIVKNIIYDKGHGKFFCRTARETYNDGHGICGELSALYMAFLRAAGINATFVEVTKDHKGDEVSHACVLIKQNDSQFLSDPAYESFEIEHIEWNEWSDEKLAEEYRSWNV